MTASVRSYQQDQISLAEVLPAIRRFHDGYKTERVTEMLDEIEHYTTDIRFADGDVYIPGDLDLAQEGICLLVVLGDLVVGGAYRDSDHPESFALVTGSMRARDVVTGGWLEVHGELRTDRLIGDYNDCSARIGGDVHAGLFYGENHLFTIGGALRAEVVIGRPVLETAAPPAGIALDDPRLLEHFDPELLRVSEDHDEHGNAVTWMDGFRDFRELKRRACAGLPFRTAAAASDG
ncbi:hypothetical protein ACWDR0_09200 [Streptomyces sp. NPDC003691]